MVSEEIHNFPKTSVETTAEIYRISKPIKSHKGDQNDCNIITFNKERNSNDSILIQTKRILWTEKNVACVTWLLIEGCPKLEKAAATVH